MPPGGFVYRLPWFFPTGISLAFLLVTGRYFAPVVFTVTFLSGIAFHSTYEPAWVTLVVSLVITAALTAGAVWIRDRLEKNIESGISSVFFPAAMVTLVVPFLACVSWASLVGSIQLTFSSQLRLIFLDWWLSESIEVAVVTPFALVYLIPFFDRLSRGAFRLPLYQILSYRLRRELVIEFLFWSVIVLIVLVATFLLRPLIGYRLLYLAFVPVIVVSIRLGVEGVIPINLIANIGSILLLRIYGEFQRTTVVEYQILLLAISISALGLGTVISDRRRLFEALRAMQLGLERRVRERTRELFETNQRLEDKIREQEATQEALQESEFRYRRLFERNLAGVFSHHPEKGIIECNLAFARAFGYNTPEEILSVPNFTLFENVEQRREFIDMLLASGSVIAYEGCGKRKDGSRVWFLVNANLLGTGGGRGTVEGTLIDITERKQLEDQFRQAQKMEAIGRLAGGVAHDFNNILMAITGYSQLAMDRLDSEDPIYKDLAEIARSAERAAGLTRQLLAFSRQQVLETQRVNLNEEIKEMENLLSRVLGEDVRLEVELDPQLGQVEADPGQIQQVVLNLVINARDAMPTGGRLAIITKNAVIEDSNEHLDLKPGEYVSLVISDEGIGMDLETQRRIFDPFFTTKEQGKGTGLGLSTVYGIVKQTGGGIEVESSPGSGSTFRLYLPKRVP